MSNLNQKRIPKTRIKVNKKDVIPKSIHKKNIMKMDQYKPVPKTNIKDFKKKPIQVKITTTKTIQKKSILKHTITKRDIIIH